ncbi:hypothetical protein L7H23_12125 [Sphingopyxis sp. BSN-002]|uniref:hypothetical protein n=1 Tax=Sphingopyxis sp. BSN-002 TaxID=2911495 RepID=UPI001EDA892B|nr:hypothetical protein [Sphingopyxis sp. BSN-002]UKK83310.1 hypothetical protein L7H23_12125 [Sphingopyxis sp. BSN-002]
MQRIMLKALGAATLLALSGTAASAQDATPICSKTVTDNCMQREGHAVAPHRAPAKHRVAPKRHAAAKHRAAPKHRVAAKHPAAPHRKVAAKAAPARKM